MCYLYEEDVKDNVDDDGDDDGDGDCDDDDDDDEPEVAGHHLLLPLLALLLLRHPPLKVLHLKDS